jgi:NADP-dependent 3-hydroxy acid dehydrogenase YdfG
MSEMKVVLITGASSGIGEAVALELSKAGHTVIVGARRTERLQDLVSRIEASGGVARAHRLDVTSRDDFARVAFATLEEFGRIDVIVNNAGVMPLSPLRALKVSEWDQMVDVNIKGVLNGIAAVLPVMETRGSGHFINVASIGAHRVSPTAAVYCATKYAVWAISDESTREAMREFRRTAIHPDAIGRAIRYAIEQPPEVDVSEIIVRPTASPH